MVAMKKIKEFGRHIGEEFGAEKVILFGSYAQGTASPDSDVDLLIVAAFEGRRYGRRREDEGVAGPRFLQL